MDTYEIKIKNKDGFTTEDVKGEVAYLKVNSNEPILLGEVSHADEEFIYIKTIYKKEDNTYKGFEEENNQLYTIIVEDAYAEIK